MLLKLSFSLKINGGLPSFKTFFPSAVPESWELDPNQSFSFRLSAPFLTFQPSKKRTDSWVWKQGYLCIPKLNLIGQNLFLPDLDIWWPNVVDMSWLLTLISTDFIFDALFAETPSSFLFFSSTPGGRGWELMSCGQNQEWGQSG